MENGRERARIEREKGRNVVVSGKGCEWTERNRGGMRKRKV